ncbi:MAG TPA: hypothetical protein VFR84_18015 [Candidatus Angelobacter sp.]|nr:hypothetical protein [Candidatus Angelobacter sp.]
MNNLMIRLLAILFLAMSSASFASASETRHNHSRESAKPQSGCASRVEEGKKESKPKTGARSEQEREFDRVLMAIYG